MAEISLELLDTHDTEDWLVKIDGIYSYLNRKPIVTPGVMDLLHESQYEGIARKVFLKALQEFSRLPQLKSRYFEFAPSVFIDAVNSLELLGLMTYDKAYTYSYNLVNKLDFCLACIFHDETDAVRKRLEERCQKFGIDYRDLSYAIMTGDISLLQNVNMQVFLNLTESLNEYINKIYVHPQTFAYTQGDRLISLSNPLHTPESRIATFIIHKVLFFAQTIFNTIIAQFRDKVPPFVESAKGMLVSKGSYNIVLTAKQVFTPDIAFTCGDNHIVLKPQAFRSMGE